MGEKFPQRAENNIQKCAGSTSEMRKKISTLTPKKKTGKQESTEREGERKNERERERLIMEEN